MAKRRCDHCHLEFDEEIFIKDGEYYFCCNGCQGVYHLLKDEGLDSFYEKLGSNTLIPPKETLLDLEKFDTQSFKEKYIKEEDGICSVALIIEGIHCAACVWLNEKVLHKMDGIIEADIHYTNNKAYIKWDSSKLKLSEIIEKIRAIGYDAFAYDRGAQEEHTQKARREYYTKMVVAIFCTMNIMWIAIAQYAGYFTGMTKDIKTILNVAEWILATPALFYSGSIFFKGAWTGLKNRFINMDLLVIVGALLIYCYSIYATITMHGETYFESATMIITFVLIGKFLEVLGKKSASDTLDKLNSQIPTEVTVVRGETTLQLTPEEVKKGDVIELKAGEKAAVDGTLLSEIASFDESSISGESLPLEKTKGDSVLSGSINIDGNIRYLATAIFSESLLSKVVTMVEDALKKRPYIETKANELSQNFSVTILLLAIFTFIGWNLADASFERSFVVAVSVIIIACPCALALATPVATLIGLSSALKKGVLFKEAKLLESVAKADVLLLDKTGTITHGKPKVIEAEFERAYIAHIYSLVASSNHPISQSIKRYLESEYHCSGTLAINNQKEIASRGLSGEIEGCAYIGGSGDYLRQNGFAVEESIQIGSEFFVGCEGRCIASFILRDEPREDAKESIKNIVGLGFEVVMLTGDNERIANDIANRVGIAEIISECTPENKAKIVDEYREKGRIVIMAGDGINDTLALSKSDIAIAMGGGSDIAMSASDIVLLKDSLDSLAYAITIGKRTYSFIKQNLAISLLYNALTIPLAILGYVIPLIAAASMSLSSLLVVGNSMRIKRD